jgi:hypothetical protein
MREYRNAEEHACTIYHVFMQLFGFRDRQTGWPDSVWVIIHFTTPRHRFIFVRRPHLIFGFLLLSPNS